MAKGGWRSWQIGRTGPVEFLALLGLALFLAAVGAFDAELPSDMLRFAYWLICVLGGGVIAALIEPPLAKIAWLDAHPARRAVAQTALMTFPITALVWAVSRLMMTDHIEARHLVQLFPNVLIVDVVVVLLACLLRTARSRAAPTPAGPVNPLAAKLPPKLARAALIAVEAEDHYLRIHTAAGSALVHMRLADALETLAGTAGLQVHRSWWVAAGAVDTVRWRQGRGELLLSNGLKAPVSCSHAAGVRTMDWGAAVSPE